jgi:hypothetical protein
MNKTGIAMSSIEGDILLGSIFLWVSIVLILWKGAAFVSKAVWVTVLFPCLMIAILLIVGITLDGAGEGIHKYIGQWDLSQLSNGEMWVC